MNSSPPGGNSRDAIDLTNLRKLLRDSRFWKVALQVIVVVVFIVAAVLLIDTLLYNLWRVGRSVGFDFLSNPSSFDIGETLIDYDRSSSYIRAILVGLLNTFRIIILGIILTSLLGLFAGIARLSDNWILRNFALVYVEVIRNTPLLLQLFFWYFAIVLQMPAVENAVRLPGPIFLSNRGIFLPWIETLPSTGLWAVLALLGIGAAAFVWQWRTRLAIEQGIPGKNWFWVIGTLAIFAGIAAIATQSLPFLLNLPRINEAGNLEGGLRFSPEFTALLIGLVVNTGSNIAEIVRAGIQAVPKGQWEAARALGLRYNRTMQMIVLPQALRVIIPPLNSQYLNLAKNSSLAVAIGYPDVYFVTANTMLNQTGKAVESVLIVGMIYLLISLSISLIMNIINTQVQLKER